MIVVTTTFEKLSPDTPYFIESRPDLMEQFEDFLQINSALYLSVDTTDTSPTTQVTVASFSNNTDFTNFLNSFNLAFPTFMSERDEYCSLNNISIDRSQIDI